jgi:hypothetical protein
MAPTRRSSSATGERSRVASRVVDAPARSAVRAQAWRLRCRAARISAQAFARSLHELADAEGRRNACKAALARGLHRRRGALDGGPRRRPAPAFVAARPRRRHPGPVGRILDPRGRLSATRHRCRIRRHAGQEGPGRIQRGSRGPRGATLAGRREGVPVPDRGAAGLRRLASPAACCTCPWR